MLGFIWIRTKAGFYPLYNHSKNQSYNTDNDAVDAKPLKFLFADNLQQPDNGKVTWDHCSNTGNGQMDNFALGRWNIYQVF